MAFASDTNAQTLPSGWAAANVGGPTLTGSASFVNGTFTVSGAGSDIGGTSDQFMFVYTQLTGDGVILAQVTSFQSTTAGAKTGVMLRESLSGNGRHRFTLLDRAYRNMAAYRDAVGGQTWSQYGLTDGAPVWLKLERKGADIISSRSADGQTWHMIGVQSWPLNATLYAGLAVTSHNTSAKATAAFTNVVVSGSSAPAPAPAPTNQPPAVSLTSPVSGSMYATPASISVAANASDADGTISRVDFYNGSTLLGSDASAPYAYTWSGVAAGSYNLTAVARDNAGATATSTPRSVTVTTPTNQPPSITMMTPSAGATYSAPGQIAVTANASDSDGTIARVDFYAGATLIGSDTASPYGATWYNVPAGTYSLTAIARDNAGASATTPARSVTVSAPTNQPPSVSLTAPASGATFAAPGQIAITASAGDSDGTIARVDFYAGTTLVGSDTTSPYGVTWSNVAAGTYSLTAVAHDNAGASTTAAARTVTVAANKSPMVALTSPAAGTVYSAPASMTITATASDSDGTVTKVDFYAGSTLIGSDTTSPYSITWSNVAAGTYPLVAIARDNSGASTSSAPTDVVVSNPQTPGHAQFAPSANHATAVDRYVLDIYLPGATPGVSNPVASQDLGKPAVVNSLCDADVLMTVLSLAPGNYVATITAIGPGGATRSAPANFTR